MTDSKRTAGRGARLGSGPPGVLARVLAATVTCLVLAVPVAVAATGEARAPLDSRARAASSAKLGLKEARVQLWRDIQRSMAYRYHEPAWGDSFYCFRVEQWKVACRFTYWTDAGSYFGAGRVQESAVSSRGDRGAAVKAIQRRLGLLRVDGDFGLATEHAVKRFQRRMGLEVDGVVGPNTREALGLWVGYRIFWRAR